jgi:hypothetical protein
MLHPKTPLNIRLTGKMWSKWTKKHYNTILPSCLFEVGNTIVTIDDANLTFNDIYTSSQGRVLLEILASKIYKIFHMNLFETSKATKGLCKNVAYM